MTCPDCEKLQKRVERLEKLVAELVNENKELKRRLALYENPNVPSSQRKYPSHKRRSAGGKRFPGSPRGHPGRTRQTPKPDVVKEPEWNECFNCGAQLGPPSFVGHKIVEEISNPSPKLVIDFLEFEGKCGECGAHNIARHPDCPPDGRLGKNALVQTTLMKFDERLPLKKVCETLNRTYGLSVTPPTVFDITRRVSDWLRPEYEEIRRRVSNASVVYTDETGEKVDGKKYWLWCFTTDINTLAVIARSRSKKVLDDTLGKSFKGTLVVDGWRSYPTFTRKLQRCWAHMLREADWLAEHVGEAKPLQKALHRLYSDLKASLKDDPPPEERARLARNAKRRLSYWLKKRYRSREIKEFVQKVRNGFNHWFTFVTTPGVEPTNNRAERALKEHVVQRKIIGTFRTEKGTKIYETIMTMLATWKQRGLDPSKALAESLSAAWSRA
jgi:transposase